MGTPVTISNRIGTWPRHHQVTSPIASTAAFPKIALGNQAPPSARPAIKVYQPVEISNQRTTTPVCTKVPGLHQHIKGSPIGLSHIMTDDHVLWKHFRTMRTWTMNRQLGDADVTGTRGTRGEAIRTALAAIGTHTVNTKLIGEIMNSMIIQPTGGIPRIIGIIHTATNAATLTPGEVTDTHPGKIMTTMNMHTLRTGGELGHTTDTL